MSSVSSEDQVAPEGIPAAEDAFVRTFQEEFPAIWSATAPGWWATATSVAIWRRRRWFAPGAGGRRSAIPTL
jgi:hypothetical protein